MIARYVNTPPKRDTSRLRIFVMHHGNLALCSSNSAREESSTKPDSLSFCACESQRSGHNSDETSLLFLSLSIVCIQLVTPSLSMFISVGSV